MPVLPVEIWSHVASFLPPEDLLLLCLVSTLHLDVSRRALAKEIVLDGEQPRKHCENLKFIADIGLSRNVQTLIVRNFHSGMNDDPLTHVRDMVNLRALRIHECKVLFNNAAEQRSLVRSLSQTRLTSLQVSAFATTFRGTQFAIVGLNDLKWKQNRGKFHPAFFSLCKGSSATITSLNIVIESAPTKPSIYGDIFDLHFPHLISLKIGPGHEVFAMQHYESLTTDTAIAFTKFLNAHATIEELVLYWDYESTKSDSDIFLPVQLESMKASSFLPNLLTLDAEPVGQLTKFVSAGVSFLQTLTTLHLWQYPIFSKDFIKLMESFITYNVQNGPSAIRHIRVRFDYDLDFEMDPGRHFSFLIERVAEAFPDLHSWTSSSPFDVGCTVTVFSRFRKLQKPTLLDSAIRGLNGERGINIGHGYY